MWCTAGKIEGGAMHPANQVPGIENTPVRQRASQNRILANQRLIAFQLIETVRANPELAAILAARSYDEARLKEGLALYQTAQSTAESRQNAMGRQQEASEALNALEARIKTRYTQFRVVCRALFPSAADRTVLMLDGSAPADRQQFIAAALTSYRAAQDQRYLPDLSAYTEFSSELLTQSAADLETLAGLDNTQNGVIAQAVEATALRDRAAVALSDWVKKFRAVAQLALKDRPDLAKALEIRR